MKSNKYICDKIATDIVYDQFEKLVSPGNSAASHFIAAEWDIEQDIRRVLTTHAKTQDASAVEHQDAIVKGKLLWDFLIGGIV